jgi:hypothetical protein
VSNLAGIELANAEEVAALKGRVHVICQFSVVSGHWSTDDEQLTTD